MYLINTSDKPLILGRIRLRPKHRLLLTRLIAVHHEGIIDQWLKSNKAILVGGMGEKVIWPMIPKQKSKVAIPTNEPATESKAETESEISKKTAKKAETAKKSTKKAGTSKKTAKKAETTKKATKKNA